MTKKKSEAKPKEAKPAKPKSEEPKKKKKAPFTHIDRSTNTLLRAADLDKKKPWLSPISNQASVEALTEEEAFHANR